MPPPADINLRELACRAQRKRHVYTAEHYCRFCHFDKLTQAQRMFYGVSEIVAEAVMQPSSLLNYLRKHARR